MSYTAYISKGLDPSVVLNGKEKHWTGIQSCHFQDENKE